MPLQFGDNSFDIVSIPFLLGLKNGVIRRKEQMAVFRQTDSEDPGSGVEF